MTKTLLLAAVGPALALALPAIPAAAQSAPTAEVAYADLDLRTNAGVGTLDGRIKRAIGAVCGIRAHKDTLEGALVRRCRADTLASVSPVRDEAIRIARGGQDGSVKVARLEVTAAARRD